MWRSCRLVYVGVCVSLGMCLLVYLHVWVCMCFVIVWDGKWLALWARERWQRRLSQAHRPTFKARASVCVYSMCAPHGPHWNAISPSAQGESVCCHLPSSKRASDWQHWHATGTMPTICTYRERTSTQQGGIGIFVTWWVTERADMHFSREVCLHFIAPFCGLCKFESRYFWRKSVCADPFF